MLQMATKKKPEPEKPSPSSPYKGVQINFRADSQELVDALDAYAVNVDRSRNKAINRLLRQAMVAKGFLSAGDDSDE